nr:MAG TPA: RNA methyltransferase [Caudoviricetes sp.]
MVLGPEGGFWNLVILRSSTCRLRLRLRKISWASTRLRF